MLRSTPTLDVQMIRCHLSTLMGREKLSISELARRTGVNRSTITALYHDKATRIELPALERLCDAFHCGIGDLIEIIPSTAERSL
jgi:putative transcriptional regulator